MQEQLAPADDTSLREATEQREAEPLLAPRTRLCQHEELRAGGDCPTVPWRTLGALWAMGFFLNCKPSEPYLSKYIMENKGVSEDDLNHIVYPFSIYGSLLFLAPVGILAEHVGYRAVIVGGLICRELTRALLIFATGVPWMATMQLTYAGSVAANSIFFAYAYVIVSPRHYALATGGVHAAYHAGNFVGSMVGELLVSYSTVGEHLQILFYISWVTTTVALFVFLLCVPEPSLSQPPSLFSMVRHPNGKAKVTAEIRALYATPQVQLASLWWVFGNASTSLCMNIFQTYFYTLDPTVCLPKTEVFWMHVQSGIESNRATRVQ
jgi:MFS family permease